jgi:hypothetical protein
LQSAQQRRPDAAVGVLGQQRDIDDADLVGFPRDVEPPGRLAEDEDDGERRARVVLLVVPVPASNCMGTDAASGSSSHGTAASWALLRRVKTRRRRTATPKYLSV